ncbi:hypothetical protein FG427_000422 [Yersinia enterocolitica]|nr:hypothetical protein [Yersinia enterocolitica]EKN4818904.1 hypothetical protein [Yersinia enterocolitica]EKN4833062.1 hypothetical protein [Yersinia enterocolitica]
MNHLNEVKILRERITSIACKDAELLSIEMQENIKLLTGWLHYIEYHFKTGVADELLAAASSSIRECAAYISLGMVRPTIFNFRTVIDLCLAWLYFKDHPMEWERVNTTGDGFKMKKEIFEYLKYANSNFSKRIGILNMIKKREIEDVYRFLSAHIHAQSLPVLPQVIKLSDIIADEALYKQILSLATQMSEYLSDIFFSIYSDDWQSLPGFIKDELLGRFVTAKQRGEYFSC